jgi:hypothetical protein
MPRQNNNATFITRGTKSPDSRTGVVEETKCTIMKKGDGHIGVVGCRSLVAFELKVVLRGPIARNGDIS